MSTTAANLTDTGVTITAGDLTVEVADPIAADFARVLTMPADRAASVTFPLLDGRVLAVFRATTANGRGKPSAVLTAGGHRVTLEGHAAHALAAQLDTAYAEADAA